MNKYIKVDIKSRFTRRIILDSLKLDSFFLPVQSCSGIRKFGLEKGFNNFKHARAAAEAVSVSNYTNMKPWICY